MLVALILVTVDNRHVVCWEGRLLLVEFVEEDGVLATVVRQIEGRVVSRVRQPHIRGVGLSVGVLEHVVLKDHVEHVAGVSVLFELVRQQLIQSVRVQFLHNRAGVSLLLFEAAETVFAHVQLNLVLNVRCQSVILRHRHCLRNLLWDHARVIYIVSMHVSLILGPLVVRD